MSINVVLDSTYSSVTFTAFPPMHPICFWGVNVIQRAEVSFSLPISQHFNNQSWEKPELYSQPLKTAFIADKLGQMEEKPC